MHTYSIEAEDGGAVSYTDNKRLWWTLSLVNPLVPLMGVAGHLITGSELWLLAPLIIMCGRGPMMLP